MVGAPGSVTDALWWLSQSSWPGGGSGLSPSGAGLVVCLSHTVPLPCSGHCALSRGSLGAQGGAASRTFLSSVLSILCPGEGGETHLTSAAFCSNSSFCLCSSVVALSSSCPLLGTGTLRDPAWPRAEGGCLAALIAGWALDRASPWPVRSSLSSARKFLLLCPPTLLPSEEPQFHRSHQGWGTAVPGWGGSWGWGCPTSIQSLRTPCCRCCWRLACLTPFLGR